MINLHTYAKMYNNTSWPSCTMQASMGEVAHCPCEISAFQMSQHVGQVPATTHGRLCMSLAEFV